MKSRCMAAEPKDSGLGFRVYGFGIRVSGLGFSYGLPFRVCSQGRYNTRELWDTRTPEAGWASIRFSYLQEARF